MLFERIGGPRRPILHVLTVRTRSIAIHVGEWVSISNAEQTMEFWFNLMPLGKSRSWWP